MESLPGSGHIDTAIWMHYMDANKTAGEEARRQLHKNATCNLKQVLAATPHKTPTVWPPTPIKKKIQVRRTRHAGHCWRSRDELISDVLLWTPTHGHAKAGRPARTYIQQLCEDTGCCPEDLPRAMNDREEWRERVRDIRATSVIWWWWWNIPLQKWKLNIKKHNITPTNSVLAKNNSMIFFKNLKYFYWFCKHTLPQNSCKPCKWKLHLKISLCLSFSISNSFTHEKEDNNWMG